MSESTLAAEGCKSASLVVSESTLATQDGGLHSLPVSESILATGGDEHLLCSSYVNTIPGILVDGAHSIPNIRIDSKSSQWGYPLVRTVSIDAEFEGRPARIRRAIEENIENYPSIPERRGSHWPG